MSWFHWGDKRLLIRQLNAFFGRNLPCRLLVSKIASTRPALCKGRLKAMAPEWVADMPFGRFATRIIAHQPVNHLAVFAYVA